MGLRAAGSGATTVGVPPGGGSVDLELFLDTEGLSFEGYYLGVDFSSGPLTIQSVTYEPLTGLFADILATAVVDNSALTIRDINQFTFSSPLPAGFYVLNHISLSVGHMIAGEEILATPGLFGESLGLGGGACPGTVACTVSYQGVSIIPEPGTALLLAGGMLGLALQRPRRAGGVAGGHRPWKV